MEDKRIETIGPFEVRGTIAKGGMGEVLLGYDPVCNREIAIKQIRSDLAHHEVLRKRFLREARLTASLTHPGIISIYSIHVDEEQTYYTMPYVQSHTFKELLKEGKLSIQEMLPLYMSVCQTVAYAHSKRIIHRDLKPENILIGTFGEVLLLDWGLAHKQGTREEPNVDLPEQDEEELTQPGRVVGTLAYLAPERVKEQPSSFQTDLYALGVILYQILTLQLPFKRKSIKELKKRLSFEQLIDPEEVAPYREVPPRLSQIVKRTLHPDPNERLQSVEELIHDLKSYMAGQSDWIPSSQLDLDRKEDWEFQENLLLSKHLALTRTTVAAEWMTVMLSKAPFTETLRSETKIRINEGGQGIGFLLAVPELTERETPFDGFCLWLHPDPSLPAELFRNTAPVLQVPDLYLKPGVWHTLTFEKVENHIHCSLDGEHSFTYVSYLPLTGTHVGVIARDALFECEPLQISLGSKSLHVSCLAVPDAFLSNRDYTRALAEYRRIGTAFPGHAEGREALFRAGITLLEEGKQSKKQDAYYSMALEEFSKLHKTPAAPLEYLGKSIVYEAMEDPEEELKSLTLGVRRYASHPLVHVLHEQIVYRMHAASQSKRRLAYQLILLSLRFVQKVAFTPDSRRLFSHLIRHWEPLPFLEDPIEPSVLGREEFEVEEKLDEMAFAIPLAFWIANPLTFFELFNELLPLLDQNQTQMSNLLFCLLQLGASDEAKELISRLPKETADLLSPPLLPLLNPDPLQGAMEIASLPPDAKSFRSLIFLTEKALFSKHPETALKILSSISTPLDADEKILCDGYRIYSYLLQKETTEARKLFERYPLTLLNQESTLLHPLFGCYLANVEGEEIAQLHFAGVIDTPYPRSWALLSYELCGKLATWYPDSFSWERRWLYRLLYLYYTCLDEDEKAIHYLELEKKESRCG